MIRVLLVEDHTAFRQALAITLAQEQDIIVAGQAGTIADARRLLANIDVAVLDLDLPAGNGASLIHEMHAVSPHALALVLTASA
ncbi:MAG: response regulator, partial [Chloroflexota bacterium]|nr:response regulator [Chloroflexota bacterium]